MTRRNRSDRTRVRELDEPVDRKDDVQIGEDPGAIEVEAVVPDDQVAAVRRQ